MSSSIDQQIVHHRIAQKAQELYEHSGHVQGRDLENWLEAERIVMSELEGEKPAAAAKAKRSSGGAKGGRKRASKPSTSSTKSP